jgi:tetratricopeptide (TPR) repeat protein
LAVLLTAAALTAQAQAPAPEAKAFLTQARAALQAGEADRALTLLAPLTANPVRSGDAHELAEAHNIACRVRFTLDQWDRAATECELAVTMESGNSDFHLWLGRALGEKASRASFLSAYSLAKRVRAEFEEAVRLDPRSADALADLGDFYYQAPSIVGGGTGKAENVAAQLDRIDAARASELRAKIAEEHKDYGTAEREIKQAVTVGAHPAFQWIGLASFYRRRERWAEMESAVESSIRAAEHDKKASVALFGAATLLIRTGRNAPLAAKTIESYLAGPVKSEEAPAFVAHLELARLKQKLGDSAAAQRERAAAQALARDFKLGLDSRH